MRIFYASGNSPNAQFESSLWRSNLFLALVDLGHGVIEFDYDLRETFRFLDTDRVGDIEFIERNRPVVTKELLRQLRAAHAIAPVDLFFSYFYDACVLPEAIDEIRAMGIRTVNWYCNGSNLMRLVKEIAPRYDWCLVPEIFRMEEYAAMGARPIYCQEAANPNIYRPYAVPIEFDVAFVGQSYGERPAILKHLVDNGIDVRVWGYGWQPESHKASRTIRPRGNKYVTHAARRLTTAEGWKAAIRRIPRLINRKSRAGEERTDHTADAMPTLPAGSVGGILSDIDTITMYSRAKINLGLSSVCGTEGRLLQIRLRDFEVPMSGGFYMVEYMDELARFFDIGKEIVCYSDADDLVAKIRYFLVHEEEREAIRQNGLARCRRDHTWQKRLDAAFREMGLH